MDLSAVINSAARQHHSHALPPHVCGVVAGPECLEGPESQQTASAVLQQGEHGGLSVGRTSSSSSSASAALCFRLLGASAPSCV